MTSIDALSFMNSFVSTYIDQPQRTEVNQFVDQQTDIGDNGVFALISARYFFHLVQHNSTQIGTVTL